MTDWQWISTGEDSLCDDMEGIHRGEEPVRPHPGCVCAINQLPDESELTNMFQFALDNLEYESYGPGTYESTMHFTFDYAINCADGSGQSGQVVVDRDYSQWSANEGENFENTDSLVDDVWSEAEGKVESILEQICPAPEPKLLS